MKRRILRCAQNDRQSTLPGTSVKFCFDVGLGENSDE